MTIGIFTQKNRIFDWIFGEVLSLPTNEENAVSARCVAPPPGSDEIQQMLPTFADFVEFVLDLGGFVVLAGLGQALAHGLQLLLVLLSHADLFLVVLERRRQRRSEQEVRFSNVRSSIELHATQTNGAAST